MANHQWNGLLEARLLEWFGWVGMCESRVGKLCLVREIRHGYVGKISRKHVGIRGHVTREQLTIGLAGAFLFSKLQGVVRASARDIFLNLSDLQVLM